MEKIISSGDAAVLDCWATWCPPCKAIAPMFEQLSGGFPQVKFFKVDVDAVDDVAQELGVRAMPTFMFFKGGEKVTEVVGADIKAIEKSVNELIAA